MQGEYGAKENTCALNEEECSVCVRERICVCVWGGIIDKLQKLEDVLELLDYEADHIWLC